MRMELKEHYDVVPTIPYTQFIYQKAQIPVCVDDFASNLALQVTEHLTDNPKYRSRNMEGLGINFSSVPEIRNETSNKEGSINKLGKVNHDY